MCSIVGSFSKQKFKELIKLNQIRGLFSYSFLLFDTTTGNIISLEQNFGEFPLSIIDNTEDNVMKFGHCQAPTGGLIEDPDRIHPARSDSDFLFHNGIIKQKDIQRLQIELSTNESWDTLLMLKDIQKKGLLESLNTIDGSFACVYQNNNELFVFRSQAGILFVDDEFNISSTKFEGAERIAHDIIFKLDFTNKSLVPVDNFKSKSRPYFY